MPDVPVKIENKTKNCMKFENFGPYQNFALCQTLLVGRYGDIEDFFPFGVISQGPCHEFLGELSRFLDFRIHARLDFLKSGEPGLVSRILKK